MLRNVRNVLLPHDITQVTSGGCIFIYFIYFTNNISNIVSLPAIHTKKVSLLFFFLFFLHLVFDVNLKRQLLWSKCNSDLHQSNWNIECFPNVIFAHHYVTPTLIIKERNQDSLIKINMYHNNIVKISKQTWWYILYDISSAFHTNFVFV